jgi:hypothetical protein
LGCTLAGKPLAWRAACLSFTVARAGSPRLGIAPELLELLVDQAFARWSAAGCAAGMPSIAVTATPELSSCASPDYDPDGPNANVWMLHDTGWPHDREVLGVTVVTFNAETGELLDADVEINSEAAALTVGDEDVGFDLASIVTHEAGHFLGLSHTRADGATMTHVTRLGTTHKRTLSEDDTAGVCAAYPPKRGTSGCDPKPRRGFTATCAPAEAGCALVGRPIGPRGGACVALLFLLACALRSRDKRDAQSLP